MILEIACNSLNSALSAQKGGADRVELFSCQEVGGLTPSYGTIKTARKHLSITLNVLIRPRSGDFLYDRNEFEIMKQEILFCKEIGVDGIVTGILTADGKIDVRRTKELVELANPMSVTFHRAFDMVANQKQAIKQVIATGVNRLLTSGGHNTALEGIIEIKNLIEIYGKQLIIMPGSGIRPHNIREIALKTGANEFHSTAQSEINSKMYYRKKTVKMHAYGIPEFIYKQTNENIVAALKEELKQIK